MYADNGIRMSFSPENKMKYDSQNGVYDASILLKQGYYNYSYLFVPKGEKKRFDI